MDLRDEDVGLIVESIETLANFSENKEREVYISVPAGVGANSLKRLKALLTENLGTQTGIWFLMEGKRSSFLLKLPERDLGQEHLRRP